MSARVARPSMPRSLCARDRSASVQLVASFQRSRPTATLADRVRIPLSLRVPQCVARWWAAGTVSAPRAAHSSPLREASAWSSALVLLSSIGAAPPDLRQFSRSEAHRGGGQRAWKQKSPVGYGSGPALHPPLALPRLSCLLLPCRCSTWLSDSCRTACAALVVLSGRRWGRKPNRDAE